MTASLADHAEWLADHTDRIAKAVRTGTPDLVARICAQVTAHQPPRGVDPAHALLVVLAAQIDLRVPVERRLAWVRALEQKDAA